MSLIVLLLVLLVAVVVAVYIINLTIPQQPINNVLKLVVGVLALLYFVQKTGLLSGAGL